MHVAADDLIPTSVPLAGATPFGFPGRGTRIWGFGVFLIRGTARARWLFVRGG